MISPDDSYFWFSYFIFFIAYRGLYLFYLIQANNQFYQPLILYLIIRRVREARFFLLFLSLFFSYCFILFFIYQRSLLIPNRRDFYSVLDYFAKALFILVYPEWIQSYPKNILTWQSKNVKNFFHFFFTVTEIREFLKILTLGYFSLKILSALIILSASQINNCLWPAELSKYVNIKIFMMKLYLI